MKMKVKVMCAWCKKEGRDTILGEREMDLSPDLAGFTSDGICEPCKAKHFPPRRTYSCHACGADIKARPGSLVPVACPACGWKSSGANLDEDREAERHFE